MAALVVINAMDFPGETRQRRSRLQPVSAAMLEGRFSKMKLLQLWEHILDIDYYPIFGMARDIVDKLSDVEASAVLSECATPPPPCSAWAPSDATTWPGESSIASSRNESSSPPSTPASPPPHFSPTRSCPERWNCVDWSDTDHVARLRVVDPACGTGTLLMAAYRQLVQNHASAAPMDSDNDLLHKLLVET